MTYYNRRRRNISDKNHEIINKEEFIEDVKRGVIVKDLIKKYNVTQYYVMKTKKELDLLDIRYTNKNRKIKKTI